MKGYVSAFALFGVCSSAHAANDPPRIDYMLPAASIAAAVQQRITECPGSTVEQLRPLGDHKTLDARFAYTVAITTKMTPRRMVALNAGSGFLVDRETKVHFGDDWYLKDFNGKTTGQGGPLIVSAIKAGAALYSMGANPITGVAQGAASSANATDISSPLSDKLPHNKLVTRTQQLQTVFFLACTDDVVKDLARLAAQRQDIHALEARIIAGDAGVAVQDLLTVRRKEASETEAKLTIGANSKKPLRPQFSEKGNFLNIATRIPPVDVSRWFRVASAKVTVTPGALSRVRTKPTVEELLNEEGFGNYPGAHGYQITITPDASLARAFGCDPVAADVAKCAAAVNDASTLASRNLVYTRPIPATVKLYPISTPCPDGTVCPEDEKWTAGAEASGSASTKLPQLSRLFSLPTGASIFGGRTVGAEFGPLGEPTMIQYNVGSSGKDVAGVLDASIAAAATVRDAEIAATKRSLDELKNAKDLQDLIDKVYKNATP